MPRHTRYGIARFERASPLSMHPSTAILKERLPLCTGRCLLPGNPKPRHAPCPRQNKQHQEAVLTAAARSHALSNMGRLLEDRGHPDEALLCFQEASTADSGSAEALCCRAGNIHRRGDLDGAAFYFQAVRAHWRSYHMGVVLIGFICGLHRSTTIGT